MNVVMRGIRNAFRSGVRSVAVILILAISMGLALSMLLANEAVGNRLDIVKQNAGTTVTLNPAGAQAFQGGGEPLYSNEVSKIAELDHVVSVDMALNLVVNTEGSPSAGMMVRGGVGLTQGETNLESSIDPGTLGQRNNAASSGELPEEFKLPIRMIGVSGVGDGQGRTVNVVEGEHLGDDAEYEALVGADLAEKNNLEVGSTFKAYDKTFTVTGIFDNGTEFDNAAVYIPLATAQELGEADKEISSATATIDSVDNVASAIEEIKSAMDGAADVTASNENAQVAVESLQAVDRVSIAGFVIALAAAGVIIFLTMMMIVRERRREIGVLKAIGGGNGSIVAQFVIEAVVLVAIGAAVGLGIAALSGNGIASALVSSNTTDTAVPQGFGPGGVRIAGGAPAGQELDSATDIIGSVTTNVSSSLFAYGALAALAIAIIGSAIPAWFITKVRPAEVLRGE